MGWYVTDRWSFERCTPPELLQGSNTEPDQLRSLLMICYASAGAVVNATNRSVSVADMRCV